MQDKSFVELQCKNENSLDKFIVLLNGEAIITSCKLEFYTSYRPSDEKMQSLALAIESNPNLKSLQLFDFDNNFQCSTVEIITKTLKKAYPASTLAL